MIEINLLPKELAKKSQRIDFNKQFYSNALIISVLVFIFVHLLIGVTLISKKIKLKNLNNIWPKISQDLKEINELKDKIKTFQADNNKISEITKDRISASLVLHKLSLDLPNGIWFRQLKWNSDEFVIEGSVVSLSVNEMELLNKYLTNLKNEKDISIFDKLELTDAKKKDYQGIEIIDFILKAKLK